MKPMTDVAAACDILVIEKLDLRSKLLAVDSELNEAKRSIQQKKQEHDR